MGTCTYHKFHFNHLSVCIGQWPGALSYCRVVQLSDGVATHWTVRPSAQFPSAPDKHILLSVKSMVLALSIYEWLISLSILPSKIIHVSGLTLFLRPSCIVLCMCHIYYIFTQY